MSWSKLTVVSLLMVASVVQAEQPFFVFDNAFTDVKSVQEQASILKELGYAGICTRPSVATKELYAAFDEHGVAISATYVVLPAKDAAIPADVVQHIESLKGRGTIVWLALTAAKASDEQAVAVIREVCDLAAENELQVVLYPHVGFRTDSVERTEHLRKIADRPNLGISFTLCHFLNQSEDEKLEETIESIAANLKLVQVSGANHIPPGKPDWSQLIMPLGEGDFDVGRVFRALKKIGYEGPVNLQCYSIAQPADQHLKTSMNAWRKYHEQP